MCNCLDAPCKVCRKLLPLHLGDYATDPSEVECYCADHLPEIDVVVFTTTEPEQMLTGLTNHYPSGWKMGIRSLTENAKENKQINHPNVAADMSEEVR